MKKNSSNLHASSHTPRARMYWRLLWLIPTLAILGIGLFYQLHVPPGGTVEAIKMTIKPGLGGEASTALEALKPGGNPDLFPKVITPTENFVFEPYPDTPVGNGLTWKLPTTQPFENIQRVEVWNKHSITKDHEVDRITMSNWSDDGQQYHIDLLGKKNAPPKWALPLAIAGGVLTLLVILRFVWDQVI
ncbi:MAG TPA: hypothetical protein VGF52_03435 [Tepidisphaeraceae bacterium]